MKTTTHTFPSVEITLPSFIAEALKNIFKDPLKQTGINDFQKPFTQSSSFSSRVNMNNLKRNFKKNYLLFVPLVLIGGLIIFMIGSFFAKDSRSGVQGARDQRVDISKPLAVEELNKSYTFTIDDENGKPVKIKMLLESAELRDQIVVKGTRADAVTGRVFFILNMKLTNDTNSTAGVYTRNYVRLSANGTNEKLAPDINNDPVQVQAISTKRTRVGLAINDTDKNLVLQIGEITGKKEAIKLHLQ